MARRTVAFVNKKQNGERLDRALLRERTLDDGGADDVRLERARYRTGQVIAADDVLRGRCRDIGRDN